MLNIFSDDNFTAKLGKYIEKYFAVVNPNVKLIFVGGTTNVYRTKKAIYDILKQNYTVRMYDDKDKNLSGVFLSILGVEHESKDRLNELEKHQLLKVAKRVLKNKKQIIPSFIIVDIPVIFPGIVDAIAAIKRPIFSIIPAIFDNIIAPVSFPTTEAYAREMMEMANVADYSALCDDDVSSNYASYLKNPNFTTYGINKTNENIFSIKNQSLENGTEGYIKLIDFDKLLKVKFNFLSHELIRAALVAVIIGLKSGVTLEGIKAGIDLIKPTAGLGDVLKGQGNSLIIDNSNCCNMIEIKNLLETAYQFKFDQIIAVIGSITDLGNMKDLYSQIGEMCDPVKLTWLVVAGGLSNGQLALTARLKGCQVKEFTNPIEIGGFINSQILGKALIIVCGSEADLLEEAIRVILESEDDQFKLIRQDKKWIDYKMKLFQKFN